MAGKLPVDSGSIHPIGGNSKRRLPVRAHALPGLQGMEERLMDSEDLTRQWRLDPFGFAMSFTNRPKSSGSSSSDISSFISRRASKVGMASL